MGKYRFSVWKVWGLVLIILCCGAALFLALRPPALLPWLRPAPPQKPVVTACEVSRTALNAPLYIAMAQQYFTLEGLDLNLISNEDPDQALEQLLSGKVDVLVDSPVSALFNLRSPQENYPRVFAQLTARDGTVLLGREPMADFSWREMKGRTVIGFPDQSLPNMALEAVLVRNQLTPQHRVTIVQNIPPYYAVGAFSGGAGDFLQAYEPQAAALERVSDVYAVTTLDSVYGELPSLCCMSSAAYFAGHSSVLQKYCNGLYRGQLWLATHTPEEAAALLTPFFPETDRESLVKALTRYKNTKTWTPGPLPSRQAFQNLQALMIANKQLGSAAGFEKLAVTTLAEHSLKTILPPKPKNSK